MLTLNVKIQCQLFMSSSAYTVYCWQCLWLYEWSQVYLFNRFERAVSISAMLNRNNKAKSTHSHPNVNT